LNPVIGKLMKREQYTKLFGDDFDEKWVEKIMKVYEDKIRARLAEVGGPEDVEIIEIGSVGNFRGFEVTVESYTPDGLISLKAKDFEDYKKLGELAHKLHGHFSCTFEPQLFDPKDFRK